MCKTDMVTIYSRGENDPSLLCSAAIEGLGFELASAGMGLIYSGGANGLTGAVAQAVLENHGQVMAVTTSSASHVLDDGMLCSEQLAVDSLLQGADEIARRAMAMLVMPGSCSSVEELVELTTWALSSHQQKLVIVFNLGASYSVTMAKLVRRGWEGGISKQVLSNIKVVSSVREMMSLLNSTRRYVADVC
jgi:uncharacterized protein (TIGR00730 family)